MRPEQQREAVLACERFYGPGCHEAAVMAAKVSVADQNGIVRGVGISAIGRVLGLSKLQVKIARGTLKCDGWLQDIGHDLNDHGQMIIRWQVRIPEAARLEAAA